RTGRWREKRQRRSGGVDRPRSLQRGGCARSGSTARARTPRPGHRVLRVEGSRGNRKQRPGEDLSRGNQVVGGGIRAAFRQRIPGVDGGTANGTAEVRQRRSP